MNKTFKTNTVFSLFSLFLLQFIFQGNDNIAEMSLMIS